MNTYTPSPTTVDIVNVVAYVIAIGIIIVAVVLARLVLRHLFVTLPQRRREAAGKPARKPRDRTIGGSRP
jgi:hypothetical protein